MLAEFWSENLKSRDHVKERPRHIVEDFIEMNRKDGSFCVCGPVLFGSG
jgi:hypothetical protein